MKSLIMTSIFMLTFCAITTAQVDVEKHQMYTTLFQTPEFDGNSDTVKAIAAIVLSMPNPWSEPELNDNSTHVELSQTLFEMVTERPKGYYVSADFYDGEISLMMFRTCTVGAHFDINSDGSFWKAITQSDCGAEPVNYYQPDYDGGLPARSFEILSETDSSLIMKTHYWEDENELKAHLEHASSIRDQVYSALFAQLDDGWF